MQKKNVVEKKPNTRIDVSNDSFLELTKLTKWMP